MVGAVITGNFTGLWGNWNDEIPRFAVWVLGTYNSRVRTQRRRVPNVGS
jgi:hypothetical protein